MASIVREEGKASVRERVGTHQSYCVHLRRATGSGDSNIKEINIFYEYFLLVCGLLFSFSFEEQTFLNTEEVEFIKIFL